MLASCNQSEPEIIGFQETLNEGKISRKKAQETLLRVRARLFPETRSNTTEIASCESFGRHLTPTTRAGEEAMVYVFNFKDNKGFAIMSANPAFPDVLAMSDKGNLNLSESMPDNGVSDFVALLDDYIEIGIDTAMHPDNKVYTVTTDWSEKVKTTPMCKVKWSQDYPYNQYTPVIGGTHAPTGCGAVAVAQAMSIFGRPTSFGGYDFNWPAMIEANASQNNTANQQIARLMEVMGRPEYGDFIYGASGTASFINQLRQILNLSGYANAYLPTTSRPNPDGSTSHDAIPYKDINVRAELESSRPVIVQGNLTNDLFSLSHFWLLHGFMEMERIIEERINTDTQVIVLSSKTETAEYVLCNWGWNGVYDGYYLNGVFEVAGLDYIPEDPWEFGESTDDYSHLLHAIINIYPTTH